MLRTLSGIVIFVTLFYILKFRNRKFDVGDRSSEYGRSVSWINDAQMLVFLIIFLAVTLLIFYLEAIFHEAVHPGSPLISSNAITESLISLFDTLKIFAPIMIAIPTSLMLTSAVFWCIPIRNSIGEAAKGIPPVLSREATTGLVKFGLSVTVISLICAAISIFCA